MATTVLVVDDSRTVRKMVGSALATAGFEILEAEDGVEALGMLARAAAPSLIVLDLNMPHMGGIELLRLVRAKALSSAPVIMLTTEGQPRLMQQAKDLGAKGWIVKPFKDDQLVAVARKLTQAA